MRRRHTRHTDPELKGATVQRSLRIPAVLIEDVVIEVASGIPDIHTLTDAVTDALWLWRYEAHRNAGRISGPLAAQFSQPKIQEGEFKDTIEGGEFNGHDPEEHDPDDDPEFEADEEEAERAFPVTGFAKPDFASIELPPRDAS